MATSLDREVAVRRKAAVDHAQRWLRSPSSNSISGPSNWVITLSWYGLMKGLRGRFAVYVPPLMEALGLCELEHNAKNNRIRAKSVG